jgi:hypothetical protein
MVGYRLVQYSMHTVMVCSKCPTLMKSSLTCFMTFNNYNISTSINTINRPNIYVWMPISAIFLMMFNLITISNPFLMLMVLLDYKVRSNVIKLWLTLY